MTHQPLSLELDFKSQVYITSKAAHLIAVVPTIKLPDKSTKAWKDHHGATQLESQLGEGSAANQKSHFSLNHNNSSSSWQWSRNAGLPHFCLLVIKRSKKDEICNFCILVITDCTFKQELEQPCWLEDVTCCVENLPRNCHSFAKENMWNQKLSQSLSKHWWDREIQKHL